MINWTSHPYKNVRFQDDEDEEDDANFLEEYRKQRLRGRYNTTQMSLAYLHKFHLPIFFSLFFL